MVCNATATEGANSFNATEKYIKLFQQMFFLLCLNIGGPIVLAVIQLMSQQLHGCLSAIFGCYAFWVPLLWYIDAVHFVFSIAGKVSGGGYLNDRTVFPTGPPADTSMYMIQSSAFLITWLTIMFYMLACVCLCIYCACFAVAAQKR